MGLDSGLVKTVGVRELTSMLCTMALFILYYIIQCCIICYIICYVLHYLLLLGFGGLESLRFPGKRVHRTFTGSPWSGRFATPATIST